MGKINFEAEIERANSVNEEQQKKPSFYTRKEVKDTTAPCRHCKHWTDYPAIGAGIHDCLKQDCSYYPLPTEGDIYK